MMTVALENICRLKGPTRLLDFMKMDFNCVASLKKMHTVKTSQKFVSKASKSILTQCEAKLIYYTNIEPYTQCTGS